MQPSVEELKKKLKQMQQKKDYYKTKYQEKKQLLELNQRQAQNQRLRQNLTQNLSSLQSSFISKQNSMITIPGQAKDQANSHKQKYQKIIEELEKKVSIRQEKILQLSKNQERQQQELKKQVLQKQQKFKKQLDRMKVSKQDFQRLKKQKQSIEDQLRNEKQLCQKLKKEKEQILRKEKSLKDEIQGKSLELRKKQQFLIEKNLQIQNLEITIKKHQDQSAQEFEKLKKQKEKALTQLKGIIQTVQNARKCIYCYELVARHANENCGHLICCDKCKNTPSIYNKIKQCHSCRKPITEIIRIFGDVLGSKLID